jgi:hypothetical protein
MRNVFLFIGVILAGCAADQSLPPLGDVHPANPTAQTAPLARSTTLTTTVPSTATKPTTTTATVYVCPMHPEVTSADPNARCRICGMRLVPRKGGPR